jgi:hypothetical protein
LEQLWAQVESVRAQKEPRIWYRVAIETTGTVVISFLPGLSGACQRSWAV